MALQKVRPAVLLLFFMTLTCYMQAFTHKKHHALQDEIFA